MSKIKNISIKANIIGYENKFDINDYVKTIDDKKYMEFDLLFNILYWHCNFSKVNKDTFLFQFMKSFRSDIIWDLISLKNNLSHDILFEFKDELNWNAICMYTDLDTNLIFGFKDYIDWDVLSTYQFIPEEVVKIFSKHMKKSLLLTYQIHLSPDFIEEIDKTLGFHSEEEDDDEDEIDKKYDEIDENGLVFMNSKLNPSDTE